MGAPSSHAGPLYVSSLQLQFSPCSGKQYPEGILEIPTPPFSKRSVVVG
eukprot:CAMPEP_0174364258 /NCGR_PEP_ID=MMETSP0811_2-20130205/72116_1 /TAXON_ID=73025 ORGANISM="Eutreptiella gymnastica-like, Strain CCMP1594" /NCGR_SAMPLE_ID=MMETSP0811_2 /ASSEMBLY_ACC=CAM_ASM_000667 /LENGTH=48 /DNA_ID= /DNA_START= /DNA_END= /DNA_ORIENTATION=